MCSSDWGHEEEKAILGLFYLDPFTTYLDETEFRVFLFEVDEGYLIEAERKQTSKNGILIHIQEDLCVIVLEQPSGRKERKILFPFCLENLSIHVEVEADLVQVYINSQTNPLQKGPFSIWLPFYENNKH